MSSIGPQLPSQPSSKRKRTPESEGDNDGCKQARHNPDEIGLQDSDSDHGSYGPQAPAAAAAAAAPSISKPTLGPTLPSAPASASHNKDEIDLDDSGSDSDTGPALPPPAPPPPSAAPAPAPALQSTPTATADSDSDSDDDDDDAYGPALPSAGTSSRRGPIGPSMPPSQDPSAPVRDEWMLAPPPTSAGYSERDPTKLKARKFASKPCSSSSASVAGGGGGGGGASSSLSAIWTETPEEKLRRLQDAVLGRSDGSGKSAGAVAAEDARRRDEEERNRKIAASIEARRGGRSLYDEHQSQQGKGKRGGGGKEEEEDDPSKRAFDREKDMSLGSKIGTRQRNELVAKSANFGGRFQKGSFL